MRVASRRGCGIDRIDMCMWFGKCRVLNEIASISAQIFQDYTKKNVHFVFFLSDWD